MASPETAQTEVMPPLSSPEERKLAAENHIQAEAVAGKHGTYNENGSFDIDFRGFSITVGDGSDDHPYRNYTVRDVSSRKEPVVQKERPVGLPRFSVNRPQHFSLKPDGVNHGEGRGWEHFGRPTETVVSRPVGMLWPPRIGGVLDLMARREEGLGERDVPYARLETRDVEGNLTDTASVRLEDFLGDLYVEAAHNISAIQWGHAEDRNHPGSERHLTVEYSDAKDASIFKDLTAQLEAEGITDWTGLTWERVKTPKQMKIEAEEEGAARAVPMTQEIVSDKAVYGPAHNGQGMRWSRVFIVRTTRHGENGPGRTEETRMTDYELWRSFDFSVDKNGQVTTGDGLMVTDVRMPVDQESFERNRQFKIPEEISRLYGGKHSPDSLDEAYKRLMLRPEEKGPEEASVKKSEEERLAEKRMEKKRKARNAELEVVLQEAGPDYFEQLVAFLEDRTKGTLKRDEERLGLPETLGDTWIKETLLDRSAKFRQAGVKDPLPYALQPLQAPHLLRSLIDQRVGQLFGMEMVETEVATVPDGVDEKGQQKVKQEIHHTPREDVFDNVLLLNKGSRGTAIESYGPVIGSYSQGGNVRKWYEKIWRPIRDKADSLFPEFAVHGYVDHEVLEQFGRMLRRTIGE